MYREQKKVLRNHLATFNHPFILDQIPFLQTEEYQKLLTKNLAFDIYSIPWLNRDHGEIIWPPKEQEINEQKNPKVMIRNRYFIVERLSIIMLAAAIFSSCNTSSEKAKMEAGTKPNIIIITADDLEEDAGGNYFSSREGEYLTDRLTDEALKIMDDADGRPLFLNMSYYTVHVPIEGKPELVEKFKSKIKEGIHHSNAGYAAMVYSLDENVGRILAKVDELGQTSNTMLIFISDNGGFTNRWDNHVVTSNYPLRSGKGALYEGGVRIPMIVRFPGT